MRLAHPSDVPTKADFERFGKTVYATIKQVEAVAQSLWAIPEGRAFLVELYKLSLNLRRLLTPQKPKGEP